MGQVSSALAVQQDGAEGGDSDVAQCELTELEREVVRAQYQGDGDHDVYWKSERLQGQTD